MTERLQIIDTHTGGEPTRVIVNGFPELGDGSLAARRDRFRTTFDRYRTATVCEPRGSDVMVGALLVPPNDAACCAGVVFFNNVGYLGMCGHGTIGAAVALGHLGRIDAGLHRLETPVGIVAFEYEPPHTVSVENVPSYRLAANVTVDVPGEGVVTGDVAWGGNWFFLVERHNERIELSNVARLTRFTSAIRSSLVAQGITGANDAEIDHVELFGSPSQPAFNSRNFVLCPGGAYDRSPCGTGTSAKLACLAADGKLRPGERWVQESIVGSVFTASYRFDDRGQVIPRIEGTACVNAETVILLDPDDPFCWGLR